MIRTNAFSLLCVAIRAVVVFVLATALVQFPATLAGLRQQAVDGGFAATVAVVMVAVLVVLALIWLYADKLARLTLARPQEAVFDSDIEPRVWLGLAVSIVGAWFLFLALKDGVYLLARGMMLTRAKVDIWNSGEAPPDWMASVVSTSFEIVLAVVFLLRGQGIARWVHRMRYGNAASGPPI